MASTAAGGPASTGAGMLPAGTRSLPRPRSGAIETSRASCSRPAGSGSSRAGSLFAGRFGAAVRRSGQRRFLRRFHRRLRQTRMEAMRAWLSSASGACPLASMVSRCAHPAAQVVFALQDPVDHRRRDGELRVPRQIQNGLHFVRDVAHRVQIQESGHALDGVKSAENSVDGFRIGGILVERQQLQLDGGQVLSRLQNEIAQQFRIARQRIVPSDRRLDASRPILCRNPQPSTAPSA